ncbi:hypothetical protein GCM10009122_39590 [Fulvivirga kasyanovii]
MKTGRRGLLWLLKLGKEKKSLQNAVVFPLLRATAGKSGNMLLFAGKFTKCPELDFR